MSFIIGSIIIVFGLNIAGFGMIMLDKQRSQVPDTKRISNAAFFVVAVLGGSLGIVLAMLIFRHKLQFLKFSIGMPAILIAQIAIIWAICYSLTTGNFLW